MAVTEIAIADPRSEDVRRLLDRHLAFAHAQVPPRTGTLDIDGLTDPSAMFYGLRVDGELLAVGALKKLDGEHAELKSMHTAEAARRQGPVAQFSTGYRERPVAITARTQGSTIETKIPALVECRCGRRRRRPSGRSALVRRRSSRCDDYLSRER